MAELRKSIRQLEALRGELLLRHQEFTAAFDRLTSSGGKGDINALANDLSTKSKVRDEAVESAAKGISMVYNLINSIIEKEHKEGLAFELNGSENMSTNVLKNADAPELLQAIDNLTEKIHELDGALAKLKDIRIELSNQIENLKLLLQQMRELQIIEMQDEVISEEIIDCYPNYSSPLDKILEKASQTLGAYRPRMA